MDEEKMVEKVQDIIILLTQIYLSMNGVMEREGGGCPHSVLIYFILLGGLSFFIFSLLPNSSINYTCFLILNIFLFFLIYMN